jgi:hypothetical protein
MKNIQSQATIEMEVTLTLSEGEARCLALMTAYGAESFLKGYRKYLGRAMVPYESHLTPLFESINGQLPRHIKRIDNARRAFNE